ncbi:Homeobox-leucine zipper protein ROC5 [Apostasia shenzhenica]|uniref:Homeobox-leucine zipper protein ROC5 n=1 Tax=Apostasia shenzhenica TaxID=1088818 RepID=A0A2H9ZTC6_9ASPA|nr:Homeobox-leucine zipper protein ROC5 [Apostasia shenzhenica]
MSFGGLYEGELPFGSSAMAAGVRFGSAGLSLGLQSNLEGQRDLGRLAAAGGGGVGDLDALCRNKEDENESRSGSDNVEGGSGDDLDQEHPRKKKRYHRHTPQQIQELESLFKENPHPDEKQRLELSKRLGLETRQVKFWFQNRRTQMKTQLERHENTILRQENEKLRAENITIRDAMRNPICSSCGGPAVLGEVSLEEQHLRIENARLKDELDRVCAIAGKFLGKPISSISTPLPNSSLELAVGGNGFVFGSVAFSSVSDYVAAVGSSPFGTVITPSRSIPAMDRSLERSMLLELALTAMDELVKMAQMGVPLWTSSPETGRETLNYEHYEQVFPRCNGLKPGNFVPEATRETTMVIINSLALVETLMDAARWADMFPGMIARATTTDIISAGLGGSRNGALQLMHAELQVLSPLVPIREVHFLRFCKQLADGAWAVVDVSIDGIRENPSPSGLSPKCRRLPSGCVVEDMPNGYSKRSLLIPSTLRSQSLASSVFQSVSHVVSPPSKRAVFVVFMRCRVPLYPCRRILLHHLLFVCCVTEAFLFPQVTWVEHAEYDETAVHQLYRSLLRSGMALGAQRWLATLQRQCECLAILMSSVPSRDQTAISAAGRRSMLKLAQRMTDNFCAGVCASSARKWSRLANVGSVGEDVRVMSRQSVDDPGEPPGVVLSAATSVWLPVTPTRLFDFLRDESLRSRWDILSNGGPMQEMAHIAKGQDHGNAVSLLSASAVNANQNGMLILQETCTDASGSLVVYAPVDVPAMQLVMNGGDSAYVALLPSGFAVMPDGPAALAGADGKIGGGSLLTVAFQILVNSLPTAKLTVESVETVNNLISCTVQKIRGALGCCES